MTTALAPAWGCVREIVLEQVEFRELLVRMTVRDLLLRYKQTMMGFGWAVFMPLMNTIIFSVIFTRVAPIQTGMPYPLFAYCGLLAFNFTASALRFSTIALTSNSNLVSKVRFPREIFSFSAVLVSIADSAVACLVLIGMMAYYGVWPGSSIVLLPLIVFVQVCFTAALGLLLSMGNLFYRDVKYLIEVALTVWMFATSTVYPLDHLGGVAGRLAALNPMTHIIMAYRDVLLRGIWLQHPAAFAATAVGSVALLVASWMLFHTAEYTFAENI
ncbi:MAG TPA: ABC transporter permease [Vicinamibacterales bacterium]|nr:ABC transporter permease [Vicinamibacterales bacterium]